MTKTLYETVNPLIAMVDDAQLRESLTQAFSEAREEVSKIDNFFALVPSHRWSKSFLANFFNSWKATHLKMLAIYGLSCRLQRLALANPDSVREQLFMAGAFNAETSYEDLGLDFGGQTHAELYNRFAGVFLDDASWQLDQYCLPKAREFKQWIYQNMVVNDIPKGLFTNMFSEIYNHGEYSIALSAFSDLIDRHYSFSAAEKEQALTYIHAHVADETEVDHFLVVVKALNAYCQGTNTSIDYEQAQNLFVEYLTRLGGVMVDFTNMMSQENHANEPLICAS
ncbi:MAG: hypothetical protein F6K37_18665 [Moorea sp. SIO4E2]|uniref:hypothetical protein n=1 Tax=Moorena sp. SIO4E2 TaxID=2607826 RepID=UPI0013B7AE0B|nr:hypothetical protein [Moorena sp. SIO4E2]NEQ07894.1 hypothetical protein [Moorena sp. SIO4E2]